MVLAFSFLILFITAALKKDQYWPTQPGSLQGIQKVMTSVSSSTFYVIQFFVTFRSLKYPIVPISTHKPIDPWRLFPFILLTTIVEYFVSLINSSALSPFTTIRIVIHSLMSTGAVVSYIIGANFLKVSNLK